MHDNEKAASFAEEMDRLFDEPEDGADVSVEETKEEFKSQFEIGPGEDESFDSITPEDEPLPFEEKPSAKELIYGVDSHIRTVQSIGRQWRSLSDVSTDGFSTNTGLVSPIAVFGSAKTTRDRGWDLTIHLPETVRGADIDQIRDGGLRIIILPENLESKIISDAVNQIMEALLALKAEK